MENPLITDATKMNDFTGCRRIFSDMDQLREFRSKFIDDFFNHKLKINRSKNDYVERPKISGYRGIHDVFEHRPRPHRKTSMSSLHWHGLLVEIQYRTNIQHALATAVE